MTAKKIKRNLGFTLVELLIVISLLGVIALIVIAAINPIELSNRTRDTQFKSDSAQLIPAVDKIWPWLRESLGASAAIVADNDSSFGFVSEGNEGVGVCGADCTVDGLLLDNDELKSEFRNRNFIDNDSGTDDSKKLFLGKAQGTSESVYSCFIPAAKATRESAVADSAVYTISAADGSRSSTTVCDADDANWITSGCYICVP